MASMSARVDTTTYTGVYDATNAKGFLVQLQYREPQGVGVWQADCANYYRSPSGRIVTQWPHNMGTYAKRVGDVESDVFEATPR